MVDFRGSSFCLFVILLWRTQSALKLPLYSDSVTQAKDVKGAHWCRLVSPLDRKAATLC